MWKDPKGKLENYVQVSNTLQIESLVIAEWNMNDFQTLANYGVYRYRPTTASSAYYRVPSSYDPTDIGDYYTDSDKSFYTFSDFVTDTDEPVLFESQEVDRSLYFDLKECVKPFRPRSGINKALYFPEKYIDSVRSARRPRYYMASRYDTFKYWNSYRVQVEDGSTQERGISFVDNPDGFNNSIGYLIEDTAPFFVYENVIPTNRIVVKMQTNLADTSSPENIRIKSDETITDPLQNRSESSIPQRWKIEYLDESDNWITAVSFDENSSRRDGTEIVKWDGNVELYYGIKIPEEFKDSFNLISYLDYESQLPLDNLNGESYVIGASESSSGTLYIWSSEILDWITNEVSYGFSLLEDDDTKRVGLITDLTNPEYYKTLDGFVIYKELVFIKGVRVVVESMIAPDTTFDLIEISPRLTVDLSRYVTSYSFSKSIANDDTGIPVGGLLASNGELSILNDDGSFTENNIIAFESDDVVIGKTPRIGSLISQYMKPNIKFTFYESILNVDGYDKFIPMKTMYSEEFSGSAGGSSTVSIPIRDFFFRVESLRAPSMFLTDVNFTSAVAMLMDNIGFSNYIFKGFDDVQVSGSGTLYPNEYPPLPEGVVFAGGSPYFDEATGKLISKNDAWEVYWSYTGDEYRNTQQQFLQSMYDTVIPYFFVSPDSSVAEVLVDLALSCQTAMFFDEYNNLVVMPKEYILPSNNERPTDITLYGQSELSGGSLTALPNIINISNSETKIINDGTINYNIRYIQREAGSLAQAGYIDKDKVFGYKPVLLWEVGGTNETKTVNEEVKQTSAYTLGAAALNTTLSSSAPYVENNEIKNNIIDLGENVYWLPRFQSYVYANGEIIRYDAVEYDISGTGKKWISNNSEYQKYFGSLPFNGKMYPTGNIRIFCEPYYVEYENAPVTTGLDTNVTYKNGEVRRHGRGQFGTNIVEHTAGISEYWTANDYVRGLKMDSKYIFSTTPTSKITYPTLANNSSAVGQNNSQAQKSSRNSIIKNMFSQIYPTDDVVKTLKTTQSGTIQASALSFYGPTDFDSSITKRDFISYSYKNLNSSFKHFGTRLRVIGKLTNNDNVQTPTSSTTYFNVQPSSSAESVNVDGGSGGIAVGINPETNHGYFFEICALTKDNLEDYFTINTTTGQEESVLHNIIFYKIMRSGDTAIPVKLWGGLAKIIVDEGYFVGMDRIGAEDQPTVYDLAVEYENIGGKRRFYLYLNNTQIAVVDDSNPLPEYSNLALFVRGSSQVIFENVYALQNLMARNTGETVVNQISDAFSLDKVSAKQSLSKYNVSGFVNSSYLSNISTESEPKFKIYYDEFGTIMRECAYFNIKYDQAYPALIAKIAETFGQDRGYSVSGFYAGSYGAEFLVFNHTDRFISLDETTGRYLTIIGVTFTQDVPEELTVDKFFNERSSFSDPFIEDTTIKSPIVAKKVYDSIKTSRQKYGKREFTLNPTYIQSVGDANNLMEWIIEKTLRTRKTIDLEVFGVPHIQLGDIVKINFFMPEGVYFVDTDKQFIVQSIDFSRTLEGNTTILRVVEI
jgi:hypothetical protein